MNSEQVMMKEIERYVNDDTYNYAFMLDGDWGSGKTYFIKEVLNKELNEIKIRGINNRVRYYSACGVETLAEFKETMIYDLLERKVDQMHEVITQDIIEKESRYTSSGDDDTSEKRGPVEQVLESERKLAKDIIEEQHEERRERFESLRATRAFRVGVDVGGKMITGMLKSKVPFLGAVDAGDYLSDVEELQDYVFIIDDIERCSFSVPALLGFINEIVEHVHAKVILVVNEKALLIRLKERRYSGDYMDYLGIREKLVGTVIKYINDEPAVLEKLICKNLGEDSMFRKSALDRIPDFCALMDKNNHHSLRTFQFFLSRIKSIEEQFKDSGMMSGNADKEAKVRKETINEMVLELFDICLKFRKKFISQEEEKADETVCFKSLKDYIENGILDVERLKDEMKNAG